MHRLPRTLTLRQHPLPLPRRRPLPTRRSPFPNTQIRGKSTVLYESPTGEPVRLQNVRFRKAPFFSARRLGSLVFYSVAIYAYARLLWHWADIEIEFTDEDEEGQELPDGQRHSPDGVEVEGEEEEEEEGPPFYAAEDSTFIPLTWSTQLPRVYYRGSDPEWQEFIRIARSKSSQKKVQDQLVQTVFSGCSTHPTIARQIGPKPKVGKYWLDISFPDGPPQEFIRSGLEIGDGYIAWSQQRVSAEQQWRITRALWPEAAAGGVWATGKLLVGLNVRRLKKAMGFEEVDPTAPEEKFRAALEMIEKRSKAQTDPEGSPGAVVQRADASKTSSLSPSQPDGAQPRSPSSDSDNPKSRLGIPLPLIRPPFTPTNPANPANSDDPNASPIADLNNDLPLALHVFNHTLHKSWHPKKTEPPRGTFVVQGLVEVQGQRGRILVDVQSAYDPKQGRFVAVKAGVRGFKKWSQGPRGGP